MGREKKTILIIDGSSTMRFYLGMLLRRLDYGVTAVRTAGDALQFLQRALPSAVLTASVLEDLSGAAAVTALRKDARNKNLPVIVAGSADPAIETACIAAGCAAYLRKPVEPDVLYRTLQKVLESTPRQHIRLATSLKVIVGDGSALGGTERTEYAAAISEGGLFVRTRYPQPQNALTPVRVFLEHGEVRAKAIVLYSSGAGAGPYQEQGMGMKFVEISDADRMAIRSFIKEQLTKDIADEKTSSEG